ncbi:alpha-tectorin-like [Glandiceps talaboti]
MHSVIAVALLSVFSMGMLVAVKAEDPGDNIATCIIKGDPHYTTFDQTLYNFSGRCTYTMLRDGNPRYKKPRFSVNADNMYQKGENNARVVGFDFTVGNKTVSVTGFNDSRYEMHDQDGNSLKQDLPDVELGDSLTVKQRDDTLYFDSDEFGVHLTWSPRRPYLLFIEIDLDIIENGNFVQGMCGDADGNPTDDLRYPNGARVNHKNPGPGKTEQDVINEFGESWEVEGTCPSI